MIFFDTLYDIAKFENSEAFIPFRDKTVILNEKHS